MRWKKANTSLRQVRARPWPQATRMERAAPPCSSDVRAGPRGRLRRRCAKGAELVRLEVIDVNQIHHLAIVVAQRRRFGFRDDAGGERLLDASRQIERGDLAGLDALDADALLERLELHREQQRFLQQSE